MDKTNLPALPEPEIRTMQPATEISDAYWRYTFSERQMHEYAARAVREAVPGWVLASERVPEIDVPVWVLMPGGGVMLGVRSEVDEGWAWCNTYNNVSFWQGKWTADDAEWDDDYQAFAWHPLPDMSAAPTQDQEPTP